MNDGEIALIERASLAELIVAWGPAVVLVIASFVCFVFGMGDF